MRVSTLIQFLFGSRRGIVDVANCRHAVWLGMLLVISAGFAREYDGEDLLHEPWYVLLPLGASLLTSFLLFVLLQTVLSTGDQDQGASFSFLSKYRAFLGLYWMTAPLAWLYAVPVERFLDAADAVRVNLWLLGIVSLWRVALMTRVVSLIYTRSAAAAFFVVMLFADSVAMIVFWLTPLPILSVMGGIRLTESEQVIQSTGFLVRFLGTATWPAWLIGTSIATRRSRCDGAGWHDVHRSKEEPPRAVTWGLWVLSGFSILIWMAILPFTQGEQINRRRVEIDLRSGRIEQAIDYMSQRDRDEFPPHWSPPPQVGYAETQPSIVDVLLHLERPDVAPWVQELFREKLAVQSHADRWSFYGHAIRLDDMGDERLASYVRLLESLPEGPAMSRYHEAEIRNSLGGTEQDVERVLSDNRRASLEALLRLLPEDKSSSSQ
jgi:hypothetical protein